MGLQEQFRKETNYIGPVRDEGWSGDAVAVCTEYVDWLEALIGAMPIMKPTDMKIIVVVPNHWGKGNTIDEALTKIKIVSGRKPRNYVAYVVHPDSYLTEMGDISYPLDFPPKKIHQVGKLEKASLTTETNNVHHSDS